MQTEVTLPPLPASFQEWWDHGGDNDETLKEVIRSYALQAVMEERERILAELAKLPYEITEAAHVETFSASIRGQAIREGA